MEPATHLEISLLGIGSETLLADLNAANIPYSRRARFSAAPVNGPELIRIAADVLEALAVPIAGVLVAWIKARSSRRLIIKSGGKEVRLEGYSLSEVQAALHLADHISALETKKPEAK